MVQIEGSMGRPGTHRAFFPMVEPGETDANPEAWLETTFRVGSEFRLAAGLFSNLRSFPDQPGDVARNTGRSVAEACRNFPLLPIKGIPPSTKIDEKSDFHHRDGFGFLPANQRPRQTLASGSVV